MTGRPARLPRSGWLAVGAAAAAGAAALGAGDPTVLAAGLLVLAFGLAVGGTRPAAGHAGRAMRTPLLAVGVGATLIGLRLLATPAPTALPPLPDPGSGPWLAQVESVGSPRRGSQVARLRLDHATQEVAVAATLPAFPELRAGMTVRVSGRLRPPPDDDPYGEYLRRTGASGSLAARSLEVVEEAQDVSLQALRDGAGDALRRSLPEPEAGLAAGILVGLRERVDRTLAADFTTAGVSHVVAISGWNIAIVGGIMGALLRGRPRRVLALAVGTTITAYVFAAGASPSVVRAAVMAGVVLAARESGRAGRAASALGMAAAILLVLDPAMIGDAGFRLSVAATAGLLAWATPFGDRLQRLAAGRLPAWLAESLGISLAAQLATLPDVLATFGRLSLVAPVVNLAVVPLVPPSMAGGFLALLAGAATMAGAPGLLAVLAGLPGWLLLHLMVGAVRIGAGVPLASIQLPDGAGLPAGLLAGAGILALPRVAAAGLRMGGRRRAVGGGSGRGGKGGRSGRGGPRHRPGAGGDDGRRARLVVAGALVAAVLLALGLADAAFRTTRLTMLDVGQGDAILVESRGGARMLVDGGPDPDRLLLGLDARIPPWDRRIDVVILSHPHEDHVAGLVRVLERYRVGRVFEPGMRGQGPGWAAWDRALDRGPPRSTLATGATLRLDEIALRVLWPDPGTVPASPPESGKSINATSIVLLGEANGRRFLLTGDAEEEVDPVLLSRGLPPLDVLKVSHHGSGTATSAALLRATSPTIALISSGAGNDYGHPSPAALARLEDAGAMVYRTDRHGTIVVELRADALAIRTAGAGPGPTRASVTGSSRYDRVHDRPGAPRGRQPAAVPRSTGLVPPPRLRGGRHGRLARPPDPSGRPGRGCPGGRGRRPAARRGQAGRGPPAGGRPARGRLRGVAGRARLARARGDRPGSPGDAPRGRRGGRTAGGCPARGADRRLRGQAVRPAAGPDGRPVRLVAATLSGGAGRCARGSPGLERGGRGEGPGTGPRPRDGRVRCRRGPPRGGPTPPLVAPDAGGSGGRPGWCKAAGGAQRPRVRGGGTMNAPILAYYRGGDGYALDRAVDRVAARLRDEGGAPPDRWRVTGAETSVAAIGERVGTAPMFGGGTLAVVTDPGPLVRSRESREQLDGILESVAPGNALVFLEQGDPGNRRAASLQGLEAAVRRAGGESKDYPAPRQGNLAGWLANVARDRGVRLERDAAVELARRVGGFVSEGDVDRQRQGSLAVAELDKLVLYRGSEPITADDVRALVAEVIPDSTWALLDAIGARRLPEVAPLLDRLVESTPLPLLVTQLHRRLRDLLILSDLLAEGRGPADLVRAIGGHPYRVEQLARQARNWSPPELEDALEDVLELDAAAKRADGSATSDAQLRLRFALWARERVGSARPGPRAGL